jgi:hypothetical protein
MNHTSSAVAAKGAEVVQVGDAIRQRAERRGLVQLVHPGRLDSGADDPCAGDPEDSVESGGEAGVPVM